MTWDRNSGVGPSTGSLGVPSARLGLVVPGPRSSRRPPRSPRCRPPRGFSSPQRAGGQRDVRQRLRVRRHVQRAAQCQRRHRRGRRGTVATTAGGGVCRRTPGPTRGGRSRGTSRRRRRATARRWSRTAPPPGAGGLLEGEALSATIAEPSRGAFVDWSRETGRPESAQEFMDAASRGRRYRSAPTPSMAGWRCAARCTRRRTRRRCRTSRWPPAARRGEPAGGRQRGDARRPPSSAVPVRRVQPRARHPERAGARPDPGSCPRSWTSSASSATGSRAWSARQSSTGPGGPSQRVPEPEPPVKTVEELLAELDALVGLADVKAEIHRQAAVLRVEGLRKDAGLTVAHDHPAPDLRRQPRHRQDDGRPTGRRHLPGARPAHQGTAGRGRPVRAGRRLPRPDRDQDRRGGRVRRRRRPVHRRGVLALRRPVRHRGDRHPGQGDGGQARGPGGDRRGLPAPDGGLHRARTPGSRAASARSSTSPTTPTTSWCRSSR